MSFAARRDFDAWFSENYDDLVQTAFALHPDAYDLVHHTYLKIAEGISKGHQVQNLPGYFHTAMWKHSANKFRKLYARGDAPQKELVSDYDLRDAIRKEEALLMANHLKWFDRKVLELYLEAGAWPRYPKNPACPSTCSTSLSKKAKRSSAMLFVSAQKKADSSPFATPASTTW